MILMILALATDFVDGFLARRLDIQSFSVLEAYADPVADLMIVLAGFGALVLRGLFPPWILPVLGGAFLQFVLTSSRRAPVYDPLGKYLGSGLFLILMGVLLFPEMFWFAQVCSVSLIVFCVVGRGIHLRRHRRAGALEAVGTKGR